MASSLVAGKVHQRTVPIRMSFPCNTISGRLSCLATFEANPALSLPLFLRPSSKEIFAAQFQRDIAKVAVHAQRDITKVAAHFQRDRQRCGTFSKARVFWDQMDVVPAEKPPRAAVRRFSTAQAPRHALTLLPSNHSHALTPRTEMILKQAPSVTCRREVPCQSNPRNGDPAPVSDAANISTPPPNHRASLLRGAAKSNRHLRRREIQKTFSR